MNFEIIDVLTEVCHTYQLHALGDAAHQAGPFIAGKIEPAALPQIFQQVVNLGVGVSCPVHSTSPPTTKVTSAAAISPSGRIKSTLAVCIVALGMPKNSELCSSCAMTVPPIFLIALTPIEPSLPVPERTTAIARSLYTAAADSNNRSAEGRTKC